MKQAETTDLNHLSSFNQIIDVRSPAEFEEDHIPGAINCPVLSNEERVQVGTLYKQVSPFDAKKLGAALVARNIAHHIDTQFSQHGKDWKPMVYCWRGGSRSGAMTHILRQIGWQASQLEGGYKTYRRSVIEQLQISPAPFTFRVICGETGTAKTRILDALSAAGAQVIDLEGLAMHKGSVLGISLDRKQPSQKMFESLLCEALRRLDPAQPVFIEAESKKIGVLRVPDALFEAMKNQGSLIRVQASVPARVQFLLKDYSYFLRDAERLKQQLSYLTALHGHQQVDQWSSWIDQGLWPQLVENLLVHHYDPAYNKSMVHTYPQLAQAQRVELAGPDARCIDEACIQAAAQTILGLPVNNQAQSG